MHNSVGEFITRSAQRQPDKVALIFESRSWTIAELDSASSALCAGLERLGLMRGDCITLYAQNCPEWIIGYYAAVKIGAVVNPLNSMLTADEAAYAMNDCGARAVIGAAEKISALQAVSHRTRLEWQIAFGDDVPAGAISFAELLAEEPLPSRRYPVEGISLDDPCSIGYTSGTTGHPKGALLSHRAIVMNTAMTAVMHVRTAHDIVVSALPCTHVYGNIVMHTMFAYGGTLVLHRTFDAARMLESIQRYRATLLEGVPTMYMYMLDFPQLGEYDLSSLIRATVGGQAMPEAKMRAVEAAFGCPLIELWGMTELGGLGTTQTLYGPKKHGSIGTALPHLQARIANSDDGQSVLAAGEVGELQIRGPVTMQGYVGNSVATAETLLDNGWLRTGDLARMDEDGFIFIMDRSKDLIITGGFNIYPAELERVLAEHPGVAMAAVGRILDETKGELAKAYVVARSGVTLDVADLERHCRERLAAYKVPRLYQIVDDLPKTSTGKILRKELYKLDE
ncbi:long-chain acyl-CoA synthetase [Paraburkholderia sp. BL23I1N1]|uniref:class I adenylate-forming enzyme family protein n=1 Tax=Paraburkholderia sp. BL23I1N1 TaxID=1938802 RepID=UPI000E771899|nr:AMP-binding protein [Paraburkholderia sp. BL23I1N1]RKE36448.1 long-chain acyl-CoA synthetase [Paraburkholderia sp. BL23I1N1]